MLKFFLRSKYLKEDGKRFLKRLSILMTAGIPLSRALDTASKGSNFLIFSEKVKAGGSFSGSLDPNIFLPSVIAMISVGENNGNLASGIAKACGFMEKKDSFRKKLIGSMIYPAFVLILCFAAAIVLVSVLLPAFSGIFNSLGVSLPPLSRFVMDIGGHLPLLSVLALATAYIAARYLMGDKGLKFPVIGRFRRKVILSSFFQAMAQSLSSGMNVIDSLDLSLKAVGSKDCRQILAAALVSVSEGTALSDAFRASGLFDETVLSLVSAGELSSSLGNVFGQLADMYEEEIESGLKTFSSLVEPVSTLATGVVVGIIIFAMFMPIIKLISVLGG